MKTRQIRHTLVSILIPPGNDILHNSPTFICLCVFGQQHSFLMNYQVTSDRRSKPASLLSWLLEVDPAFWGQFLLSWSLKWQRKWHLGNRSYLAYEPAVGRHISSSAPLWKLHDDWQLYNGAGTPQWLHQETNILALRVPIRRTSAVHGFFEGFQKKKKCQHG